MSKVKVGDLVCMYRRKNKGMGIVLEHAPDLVERAGADTTFVEVMEAINEIGSKYADRAKYRDKLKQRAKYPELIHTFLIYNASWARKPKKEVVRIRWFDCPSMYEHNKIREDEEWCPADWVKKL